MDAEVVRPEDYSKHSLPKGEVEIAKRKEPTTKPEHS